MGNSLFNSTDELDRFCDTLMCWRNHEGVIIFSMVLHSTIKNALKHKVPVLPGWVQGSQEIFTLK